MRTEATRPRRPLDQPEAPVAVTEQRILMALLIGGVVVGCVAVLVSVFVGAALGRDFSVHDVAGARMDPRALAPRVAPRAALVMVRY